jgi:hypothetical protein
MYDVSIYVYMYICIYVYMYICIYMYVVSDYCVYVPGSFPFAGITLAVELTLIPSDSRVIKVGGRSADVGSVWCDPAAHASTTVIRFCVRGE